MLLTKKSNEIIDSCRFCWMCRHICPIGNATGQERNNARARALSLSLVNRNAAELSGSVADNIYECALCGACTKDCATGWDPVAFTKDVRLQMAMEGRLPAYIETLLNNLSETGNPYGAKELDGELEKEIASLPASADTLLFLGTDTRYKVPQAGGNAIRLLKKAGVSFTVLLEEPDSGYTLDTLVGAAEDTRETMTKAAGILSEYSTVIALDPADAKVFRREYKEWDIPLTARVETFPEYAAGLIVSGKLKLKPGQGSITIQDPALLARDLEETESLRTAASACGEIREMLLNRKDTMWAGNLLMDTWMPDVMTKVAAERWRNAQATGADALVTASPSEYAVLKKAKPDGMKLLTLEELLLSAAE